MYCEYIVIIFRFLKSCLQESVLLELVICKMHKNFQFKILHFLSFSGWLQLILKQMIKPMQTYWSRSMITGLNRFVEHLYCENCQVKC